MATFGPGWLNSQLLGISSDEALFSRRGFASCAPQKQRRLERIGRTFIAGYTMALSTPPVDELSGWLDRFDPEQLGFAYEGAGMALALTDLIWRQRRFQALLEGPGAAHRYMLHVGWGWAAARIPWMRLSLKAALRDHDPVLWPLVVDGYGFHEGYFHWPAAIVEGRAPRPIRRGYGREFDRGLGRCLWFFNGADAARAIASVQSFAPSRRADLWSGVALAATYAGGASRGELEQLRRAAGPYASDAAQGACFAATARVTAGNLVEHTEVAARVFCDRTAAEVAALAERTLEPARGTTEPYEKWRAAIRRVFENTSNFQPA